MDGKKKIRRKLSNVPTFSKGGGINYGTFNPNELKNVPSKLAKFSFGDTLAELMKRIPKKKK